MILRRLFLLLVLALLAALGCWPLVSTAATNQDSKRQAGWTVLSTSARGVLADMERFRVAGSLFTVVRFRESTTAFHLHAGSIDPPGGPVPGDAASRISASELLAGVVGAFNGGFKVAAKAGGVMVDGKTLSPMAKGMATAAIDRYGHLRIGVWGIDLPVRGMVAYRQNLPLLVSDHRPTPAVLTGYWGPWGAPLHDNPAQPRSALGVSSAGDVLYVASMDPTMPLTLATALVRAGAQRGMELDMNPAWPSVGVAASPTHSRAGVLLSVLPGAERSPQIYLSGSPRDFFVVSAEPASWGCQLTTPGLLVAAVRAQPFSTTGSGC